MYPFRSLKFTQRSNLGLLIPSRQLPPRTAPCLPSYEVNLGRLLLLVHFHDTGAEPPAMAVRENSPTLTCSSLLPVPVIEGCAFAPCGDKRHIVSCMLAGNHQV